MGPGKTAALARRITAAGLVRPSIGMAGSRLDAAPDGTGIPWGTLNSVRWPMPGWRGGQAPSGRGPARTAAAESSRVALPKLDAKK